jgi:hypothetical protein
MRALAVALAAVAAALAPAGAQAAFGPVGADLRFTFMGPDGSQPYDAFEPSVAYNPQANEYLVVWVGDDDTPPLVDEEFEIFAQRLSGAGRRLGGRIRVSAQGPDGATAWRASEPTVAYNPVAREYLVAWQGRIATTDPFGEKVEIWSRRLSAAGARLGGSDDTQVSDTGLEDSNSYDALNPSIAADTTTGEYLVVWEADDVGVDDEFEIMGQRLDAAGAPIGGNDFRISEQGADGNPDSDAFKPSVAYDPVTDEFMVVWEGEIGTTDVFDIWGQRLSADGAEVGGNDFRIGDFADDALDVSASVPSVAANPVTGEYLVVWAFNERFGSEPQLEIHGQRLTAAGAQTGADDFRISNMDVTNSPLQRRDARDPSVAAGSTGEYVVVWSGDDEKTLIDGELEVFGQRLTAAGVETGADDFRISHMGIERTSLASAAAPSIAAASEGNQLLVAWQGDDLTAGLFGGELEIYGRRLGSHFGTGTRVKLALAAKRIRAAGPVRVRLTNRNEFAVTGKLSGRLRGGRGSLGPRAVRVAPHARRTVRLKLPRTLRLRLAREGALRLRLTARVEDPAGLRRTVTRTVRVRLR